MSDELTPKDTLTDFLTRMSSAIDQVQREDEAVEIAEINRVAEHATEQAKQGLSQKIVTRGGNPNWYRGMPSPNPSGMTSRKPITDALLEVTTPKELAEIVMQAARKGKDWAVKLAISYVQAPETLSRLAGSESEPVRIEQLATVAREMGLDVDAAIRDGESMLRDVWQASASVAVPVEKETGENTDGAPIS